MNRREIRTPEQEGAALIGTVLDLVYKGSLTADGPAGKALVQHLEGAVIALQVLDAQRPAQ